MIGPPTAALVPPGQCQFGDELTAVPLLERTKVSPTSSVLRFGVPDSSKPLNLSTCACILANADIKGENVTRPYTPISTNAQVGSFDLLVKDYGPENGTMSYFLCNNLQIGDQVRFKHISFNVKTQAPFHFDTIGMMVGGTGITPMIQALHAILGSPECESRVVMLYGSQTSNDILGNDILEQWANAYPNRFKLVKILSHEPESSDWKGERGFINKEMVEKYLPSPSESNTQIWICGPPPMYNALTGPREESHSVSGLLGSMGYKAEQVYKF